MDFEDHVSGSGLGVRFRVFRGSFEDLLGCRYLNIRLHNIYMTDFFNFLMESKRKLRSII